MERNQKGKGIICLPSDYIVIDTETTGLDFEYCDLIEVSAIKFEHDNKVAEYSSLVKPNAMYLLSDEDNKSLIYVDKFIEDLTGITNEMLAQAREPEEVIPEFLSFVGDSVLIGHNVNFDINFIYDAAARLDRSFSNDFIDTLRISKKLYPELEHHRLSNIATRLNIDQTAAHRSLADSETTAACYQKMKSEILSASTENEFVERFKKKSCAERINPREITINTDCDDTNPFYGEVIVFTGALSAMTRLAAMQLVAMLGGIPEDSITKKTNYLVVGNVDFSASIKDGKSGKMKKAEAYALKGCDIHVLSESAFLDVVNEFA